jgi:sialidase-1
VFAAPATRPRDDLQVRLSYDEGKTWPVGKLLLEGPAGYSDMAAGPDGTVYILYEQQVADGSKERRRDLVLGRFGLEWLTNGADRFE